MSAVDLGLVAGMTLGGTASARRLKLSSFSSSACGVARWSPRFSTTPPTTLIAAAGTNPKVTLQKLRSANSSGQPWLVLPPQTYENPPPQKHDHGGGVTDNDNHLRLFDIENGTVVPIPMPRPLPEGEELNWRWIGSSQGWLIMGHEKAHLLCLFNPADALCEDSTKSSSNRIIRISLPDTYPRRLPQRVFLTSPPPSSSSSSSSAECQVFAMGESYIAFCSLNAADSNSSPPWKLLFAEWDTPYEDVFLDGRWLITLTGRGIIMDWNLDEMSVQCLDFHPLESAEDFRRSHPVLSLEKSNQHLLRKVYLLKWSPPGQQVDEFLLVKRYVASYVTEDGTPVGQHDFPQKTLRHKTLGFDVYSSHSPHGKYKEWESVESLGERALFLGYNQSLAIPVAANANSPIKSNCIYFTDDYEGEDKQALGGHDCGVFDMADQTIRSLDYCEFAELPPRARPIWLLT